MGAEAATDAELQELLDACPASFAQQTPAWRDVITSIDGDQAQFVTCRRDGQLVGVLPAYRYAGPLGAIFVSCAQAGPLGGVACRAGVDPEPVYGSLLQAFQSHAASSGCGLATVITNPFWPDRELCERLLQPDYVLENRCQALDLEEHIDEQGNFQGADMKLRYNLRRAQKGVLLVDEDQTSANVNAWHQIHSQRHTELGIEPLPLSMFTRALESVVPQDKGRFFFVRLAESGEMVAGGLFLYHGSVIDMLISSGSNEHARHRTNYLTALHAMRFARRRGLRTFNWQGSPPNSGVYHYKMSWGSRDVSYAYLTKITGEVEPFLASTPAEIGAGYRWHYALPFDRVGPGRDAGRGPSSRADAWSSSGESESKS